MVTIRCKTVTFSGIQAVLFDKDGTLADSAAYLRQLAQRRSRLIDAKIPGVQEPLLMAFGVDAQINPAGLMAVGTRYENEVAAAAYIAETGRDWIAALEIAKTAFVEADQSLPRKADYTPVFEGVVDLLSRLTSTGLKLGILSSDTSANVTDFVERYQLQPYLPLQLGTDAGPAKPHPALMYRACQALGVAPEATLVVGDALADVQMAEAAGAAGCIGAVWGWTQPPALEQADVLANHCSQIQIDPQF